VQNLSRAPQKNNPKKGYKTVTAKTIFSAVVALAFVAACGEQDIILPGERLDIRPEATIANETRAINLVAARANADWTHRNGGADHQISHPALGANLTQAFAVNIGAGDSLRARLTAEPVVSNGVIYTVDARATVTATTTAGQQVWTRTLSSGTDGANDASGGGISVSGNRLFVTTGFGKITALDTATGGSIWTQDLDAPGGASPTVFGDLVYVVGRDSAAWALDVDNGRIRWQLAGTPSSAGLSGGAGVAVNSEIAVFPFPSGDVIAAFPQGGLRRWSTVVTGARLGSAAANISDIAGDPVIDGNRLYVGNFSGLVAALDISNGDRIWTAREGTVGPVWPAGGSVFLVNDVNELVRLDDNDGSVIWRVDLPDEIVGQWGYFNGRFAHYGPVLAGGRLIVASSDGQIRSFDPASGALIGSVAIEGGAASNPVVAGQTLYVISKLGNLHAFR
jgi:outer membrane protein assembly factor BamB